MWFKLEATSCFNGMDVHEKYCEKLSTFNVRILNVPRLYFTDIRLHMDVLVLVELNTLEDFIRLRDFLNRALILRERKEDDKLIEIYDSWREWDD